MRREAASAIFIGIDGALAGVIGIADPIKQSTPDALRALKEAGIEVIMLTGDNRITGEAVARNLGISRVEAEVLPDQKSAVVAKLRGQGRIVAMAGDGVNDAPALAAADVGIAMGTGTDVAIESAGVTLVRGDLNGIVRAYHRCRCDDEQYPPEPVLRLHLQCRRHTDRRRALPVFGALSPMVAAAAMAASSVSVILQCLFA
jgi:Cu+-exporting ATPase